MFAFHSPLWLLLLILPIGFVLLASWWRPRERHNLIELGLRLLALVLLIVAIAQPEWHGHAGTSGLAILIDTSSSISAADRAIEATWIQNASANASSDNPLTIIRFAGAVDVLVLYGSISYQDAIRLTAPSSDAGATDIQAALRLAAGVLPPGSTAVLLTDGIQTSGAATSAVAALTAQGIVVDSVLLDRRPADVALTRLVLQASTPTGTMVPLQMTVESTTAVTATVQLAVDGRSLGSEPLGLQAGANPYLINIPALTPGRHIVQATVSAPGDGIAQNNVLNAVTTVSPIPRVLLVAAPPDRTTALALLRNMPLTIVADSPEAMPATVAGLEGFDGIVLDDLPASALSARQVTALTAAVHAGGSGLLVLGGTHSLTQGHYSQTALENLLPVLSDTPASLQNGNVALQLVLDRSGSMADLAGDEPKILMSRSAAAIAVDFAEHHQDDLGIVSFDYYTHLLFPMQLVTKSTAATAHSQINGMTADGGTNIYSGLKLGIQQVLKSNAPYRHIILMTDGRSDPADYTPLLQEAQRDKITISTLALGSDADTELLHYMAAFTKGNYYYTANASDLPRIFAEEARLSAGSAAVAGKIGVQIAAASPAIRSLGTEPPADLSGYTATVLKPNAVNDLQTSVQGRQPDPLLAQWQYGLGRVLVWTPGLENNWSASWRTTYPNFWSDIVDWILRGSGASLYSATVVGPPATGAIQIDTQGNAGTPVNLQQLALTVDAPNGKTTQLQAAQTGPGIYLAPFQFTIAGVYTVTVQPESGGPATISQLAVPYGQEYVPGAADGGLLLSLDAATRGRTLAIGGPPSGLGDRSGGITTLWWPVALTALAAFLAALTAGRFIRSEE